ncbi:hypothetical protein R3X27_05155 [Tropicimonas sp. TH_r6]|uniref:hypothetical protein n=1 Tax=Tropicimonas sp. TH_r6 TaxID=3082085 RepID=UPI0029544FB2|nr:hypothetical protein [Tropicimonas sp. TH_r6]MDV7142064.1 hypothetical protein [Tropicimonas sp. TH_r6]
MVNEPMKPFLKQAAPPVLGIDTAPPRPTFRSALWLACALSVPVFLMLGLLELLVRLAF